MESLSADFGSLLQNSDKSDLTLVCCDGEEVKVHRIILAARSPAFSGMLESDMQETISGRIEVKDFSKSVVKAMVQFIYTAQIEEEFEDIVELLKIGNKYLIKSSMGPSGELELYVSRLCSHPLPDRFTEMRIIKELLSTKGRG